MRVRKHTGLQLQKRQVSCQGKRSQISVNADVEKGRYIGNIHKNRHRYISNKNMLIPKLQTKYFDLFSLASYVQKSFLHECMVQQSRRRDGNTA